jgi:N-methylhydantoinase A
MKRFHARHDELFGYSEPEETVEVVNLRLVAVGLTRKPEASERPATRTSLEAALKESREIYFAASGGWVETPIYDGHQLERGHRIEGGAVVEQRNTTIVVEPGFELACDRYGNYILSPNGGGRP